MKWNIPVTFRFLQTLSINGRQLISFKVNPVNSSCNIISNVIQLNFNKEFVIYISTKRPSGDSIEYILTLVSKESSVFCSFIFKSFSLQFNLFFFCFFLSTDRSTLHFRKFQFSVPYTKVRVLYINLLPTIYSTVNCNQRTFN